MKTIICGQFKQETNRFAPGLSDTAAYRSREYYWGEAEVRRGFVGSESEMGAFFTTLDPVEECHLVPVLALNAPPGPVTAQAVWEKVAATFLEAIEAQPQVDGILLALHGAMATEDMEDGEGQLLELLRKKVGPNVPIVTSLDLHANITQKMVENATALVACDYYPHTDMYQAGLRAAKLLWQAVQGEIKPVMAYHKLDMLFPFVITSMGPIVPLVEKAQKLRENTLLSTSICQGFFHSDIHDLGAAVLAVADGDLPLAQHWADTLAQEIWDAREGLQRHFYTAQEAVKLAMAAEGPVVLADVADNPGGGATMDSVVILRTLLENGATNVAFACIHDPQVVRQAQAAGIGATISVELGGKEVPDLTGGPLSCEALVENLTDGHTRNQGPMLNGLPMNYGDCALLRIGGIRVVVCCNYAQPYDMEIYRHVGIDPTKCHILVTKSSVHFRADFSSIAKEIYDVETPALCCMRPQMLPLARCRRPIYPLEAL